MPKEKKDPSSTSTPLANQTQWWWITSERSTTVQPDSSGETAVPLNPRWLWLCGGRSVESSTLRRFFDKHTMLHPQASSTLRDLGFLTIRMDNHESSSIITFFGTIPCAPSRFNFVPEGCGLSKPVYDVAGGVGPGTADDGRQHEL